MSNLSVRTVCGASALTGCGERGPTRVPLLKARHRVKGFSGFVITCCTSGFVIKSKFKLIINDGRPDDHLMKHQFNVVNMAV